MSATTGITTETTSASDDGASLSPLVAGVVGAVAMVAVTCAALVTVLLCCCCVMKRKQQWKQMADNEIVEPEELKLRDLEKERKN